MKFPTLPIILLLVVWASFANAQEPLSIHGPEVVSGCDLVRLEVSLADNETALWIVEPDDLDYEIVGNKLIFTLGCEPQASLLVVAASVVDGTVKFRQMRHRVKVDSSPGEPTPADPPDEPNEPPAGRDWSAITEWISDHEIPEQDPSTARRYAESLRKVAKQIVGKSLTEAHKIRGFARTTVFGDRDDFDTDWNTLFLQPLDARIKESPPKDLKEYIGLINAIAEGLE